MITWPAKDPAEVEDFLFDFTGALDEGETLATRTVTVNGATKDSDTITDVAPGVQNGVRVWVSGGAAETAATVTALVTTSGGRTFSETAVLPIGVEPLSLADVKAYLRVLTADEDAKIAAMIPRARLWVEDFTGLALVQRQFTERRRVDGRSIRLSKGPLVSVDATTYGDAQTYTPRSFPPDTRIVAAIDSSWPLLLADDAFEITYTAGYAADAIDERLIGAMLALVEGEYSTGQAYPQDAVDAAERCCGYLRMPVL